MVCGLAEAFKMIATCAFCGCPILPGQGVGVFAADLTVEQSARAFRDEHGQAMSCTSQDCLPSGGFYAGTWNGTGINSPFAHGNSAMEAFMTGKPVVSSTQR